MLLSSGNSPLISPKFLSKFDLRSSSHCELPQRALVVSNETNTKKNLYDELLPEYESVVIDKKLDIDSYKLLKSHMQNLTKGPIKEKQNVITITKNNENINDEIMGNIDEFGRYILKLNSNYVAKNKVNKLDSTLAKTYLIAIGNFCKIYREI